MAEILYDNEARYELEFNENLSECVRAYGELFAKGAAVERADLVCVRAPGRINIIGEHIDYNDGFVLPMAIPLYTVIVGRANGHPDRVCRIKTLEKSIDAEFSLVEFSLNDLKKLDKSKYHWANYMIGVLTYFKGTFGSFDAVLKSNVPLGAGLSSSAALEVATYTFLEHLSNQFTDPKEKATMCQKAEHNFASVPCGIMDQFISTMATKGNALLIDCRSLESKPFPLDNPNVALLITNSNVKHSLEGSEYSSRREQCESVAKKLGKSLRDASLDDLNAKKGEIDELSYRRAHHAITEIARTEQAAEALKSGNLVKLGHLMNESHNSLRDDFNVSCVELDMLVDIARHTPGVYGSRMTGGGFGGCTITLVDKTRVQELLANIRKNYKGTPSFYVCNPCDGAGKIAAK